MMNRAASAILAKQTRSVVCRHRICASNANGTLWNKISILQFQYSYLRKPLPIPLCRHFSTTKEAEEEDVYQKQRHSGIIVHPDSITSKILPGNWVMKKMKNGSQKKRYTELVYGYFWHLKDLNLCNDKIIQSNKSLIPEKQAKTFPPFSGFKFLSATSEHDYINLPDYFLRCNRSRDPAAHCTLVAICFRDIGYSQLPSWIDPFEKELGNKDRVRVVRLNISVGFWVNWILQPIIAKLMKRNTTPEVQDQTLLYFTGGNDSQLNDFRDALRMYNEMTGYVLLLDGIGRVRFAGSGTATDEEAQRLISFAKELTPLLTSGGGTAKKPRRRKNKKRPTRSSAKQTT